MIRDAQLREQYRLAVQFLPNRGCYVAAEVLELGVPVEADWIPTAAVTRYDDRLLFLLNREWARTLTVLELSGLLVHEALHVTHRHVFVTPPSRTRLDDHLYNLACDAVINDLILRHYPRLDLPPGPIIGPELIGRSTLGLTAEQVYAIVRRNAPEGCGAWTTLDVHAEWDGFEGFQGDRQRMLRDPGADEDRRAQLEQALRSALEGWETVDSCGTEALGAYRVTPHREPPCDLERLLRERIGSRLLPETRWAPPERRLLAFYPDVLLPRHDYRDQRQILLALDASGSIVPGVLGAFTALARRPLQRSAVSAVTFDTQIYPFDPTDPDARARGGGGTSFQPIEDHARTLRHYPDVVVVVTDGFAPRPRISRPERWLWCLTTAQNAAMFQGLGERVVIRV